MRDETAYLDSVAKPIWRGIAPVGKGTLGGQAVEAVIKLYTGEVICVELQPLRLGQLWWIENIPSVQVDPAACTDVIFYSHPLV